MKEQLISFETAKLAKEKKFDIQCIHGFVEDTSKSLSKGISEEFYWELGERPNDNYFKNLLHYDQKDLFFYSRPTQSLLQKWLREEHNIHIEVWKMSGHFRARRFEEFTEKINFDGKVKDIIRHHKYSSYLDGNTYEEALEKGLQEALKLI